ncbi:spore germination protein [Gehongia tenuis]|uniref:Spore germination protein n=1 Tax=Gehongia tenuis TaxID=2763655 RepID=A0A926D479_9FIRM|nr:spore germination protein [Gehongia tenuis]MBC8531256.1 spore germination protein [Gehongia tenuis]
MKSLTASFKDNIRMLDSRLRVEENFDIVGKDLVIGERRARMYLVDGFIKDEVMEKVMEYIMALNTEDMTLAHTAKEFSDRYVTYVETDESDKTGEIVTAVLSGTLALIIEGYEFAVMIDARTYPVRNVQEPEDDRVLRGARDGFVETLVFNTALIRRRIRDPKLTMDIQQVGSVSKTDVVLCYMEDAVDKKLLDTLKKKIAGITISTLTMGQESLAECLVKTQWYNPFPKVRYTERPDAAAASALEGSVLIIVDNSPSVMVIPSGLLDFLQDTNDYYFPPLVGTYLRFVRIGVFLLTLLLTPVWFLLIQNPDAIPSWLEFIKVAEPNDVPIIWQLLIIEFIIDGLKIASLNTPTVLSNSFSIVGALILGDFAVQARWFVPEVVLYMAFVAIANFTQPSFELGYAFKLFRVLILVLTALFNIWGFAAGLLLMLVIIATTRTVGGKSYLYPLIPFDGRALGRLLIRQPINRNNTHH